MRTTLTIDDDLMGILKKRAQELGVSFKEVVNRALRQGLGEVKASKKRPVVKTRPFPLGFKPGINLDKMNQLFDELETEAFLEKNRSGKA